MSDFRRETDPIRRFSNRVDDYVKYRPDYPGAVLACLVEETGLKPSWMIADIGSGTGILSRLFLENGNKVFGVEPNAEMREAGEQHLSKFGRFASVDGRAEATGLDPASVDLVSAAQAFHWFDMAEAKREFRRILAPGGWVTLVWNTRTPTSSPFMRDYEALLVEHALDYQEVDHRNLDVEALESFFDSYRRRVFNHFQDFDYAGLEGRLMSSSYAPSREHPKHRVIIEELKAVFDAHQREGIVRMEYDTEMYVGSLAGDR